MTTQTLSRPVSLDRGDLLRIRDGSGVTVRPDTGVLWVTEERSRDDRIVTPGYTCKIEGAGLALVFAHRAARVVIGVPAGSGAQPDVRLAVHGGDTWRRIHFGLPRGALVRFAGRLRALWRRWRRAGARAPLAEAPVGGRYEHDRFLSSRRQRGSAGRSLHLPFEGTAARVFLPPYY